MVWLSGRGPPVRLSQTVSGGPDARPYQGRCLGVSVGADGREPAWPGAAALRLEVGCEAQQRLSPNNGSRKGGGWVGV